MTTFQYFAYGSNMLTRRLQKRCATARVKCLAKLHQHTINFSKKSTDGSGKATVITSDNQDCVYGVVFDIEHNDLSKLDRAEGAGHGYERKEVVVKRECDGEEFTAITYMATSSHIDASLLPYDWYLQLVIAGAMEHGLPISYTKRFENQPSIEDPKLDRPSRKEALELLEEVQSTSTTN